jgi:hypothetical protein
LQGVNAMRSWPWPGDLSSIPGGVPADAGSVAGVIEYLNSTSVDGCEKACAEHERCGVWAANGEGDCYLKLDNIWWPVEDKGKSYPVVSGCALNGTKAGVIVYNCGNGPRPGCCSGECSPDPRCDMSKAFAPPAPMGTCDSGSPSFGQPWCDQTMSDMARAVALTAALTVDEKLRLWTLHSVSYPVARLNLKSFARDTICQHGLSNNWNEGHWFLTNSTVTFCDSDTGC